MSAALKTIREWTADAFVKANQSRFGNAWRYELVDGVIIAHDAPEPDHGAILAGLIGALTKRASELPPGCRPEIGSAAIPLYERRNTARIPDAVIRCQEDIHVSFEVLSPTELRNRRDRDRKRRDMQAVQGIRELVDLYQNEFAAQVYRLLPGGAWAFETVDGLEEDVRLESVGFVLPMAEIYQFANPLADPVLPEGPEPD